MKFLNLCTIFAICFQTTLLNAAENILIEKIASDYNRCLLNDPSLEKYVKETGNLAGQSQPGDFHAIAGWFEYDVNVPIDGWYELLAKPNGDNHEYIIDGEIHIYGQSGSEKVSNLWLNKGKHIIRIQRLIWTGFSPINTIALQQSKDELSQNLRIEAVTPKLVVRKGSKLDLNAYFSNNSEGKAIKVWLKDQEYKTVKELRFELPVGEGLLKKKITVPLDNEGLFRVHFGEDNNEFSSRDIQSITVTVIDTTPRTANGSLKRTLIKEIDCVKTSPDYFGGSPTRVINKPFGGYRESGDKGWLQHHNSTDPGWFAYKLEIPSVQKHYMIEYDYPDDAKRTFVAAIRESNPLAYPVAGGVDSGGEFSLSNKILTQTLFLWPRSTDVRFVALTPQTGLRAAVSKIRLYSIDSNLPLLDVPQNSRIFANWYEEGTNFLSMYGAPDNSITGMMVGADRYARSIAYMGGNLIIPTVSVYQMNLFPSRYNVNFADLSTYDTVSLLLLNCEKYGLGLVGEFHPEGRELRFASADSNDLNRCMIVSKDGKMGHTPGAAGFSPSFSPIVKEVQDWYIGMLVEFAERYKDSPSFKGVCLRLMTWANPSLNNLQSIDWGYEDYSVNLFCKETGIKIPVDDNDPLRFRKRYDWLMANSRDKWIDWRCEKITDLHKRICQKIREVRPDLRVYSDFFVTDESSFANKQSLLEAGLDISALNKIEGFYILNSMHGYGRRYPSEMANQIYRDYLIDPANLNLLKKDNFSGFLFGTAYFEATEVVAIPEDMGFPNNTKRTWTSGVVNPAGRHYLERYALALGECDAAFLGDGGNAYTMGQPELREFLKEYRSLPADHFSARSDATDPVAIWEFKSENDFYFYAVNRESYPITAEISFAKPADVLSLSTMQKLDIKNSTLIIELAPFQLLTFKTAKDNIIEKVSVQIPDNQIRKIENNIKWVQQFAEDIKTGKINANLNKHQIDYVNLVRDEATACFKEMKLWRARTILENHKMLEVYQICNQYPPSLRDNGSPITPKEALGADKLYEMVPHNGRMSVLASERIIPAWAGEKLLTTEDSEIDFHLNIPYDGQYSFEIGHAAGENYGPFTVILNEKAFTYTTNNETEARGNVFIISEPVSLKNGIANMRAQTTSGKSLAISYLKITPIYRDIAAKNWMVVGPYLTAVESAPAQNQMQMIETAMKNTKFSPEHKRDFDSKVLLENGSSTNWKKIDSESDFVNFADVLPGGPGSISYAVTYIYSPHDCRLRLNYGVDYWIKIWLNDEIVQDFMSHSGPADKGQFIKDISLNTGWNELFIKVASGTIRNGFWMSISDPGNLRFSRRPENNS